MSTSDKSPTDDRDERLGRGQAEPISFPDSPNEPHHHWSFWKCLLASVLAYCVLAMAISPAWEDTDDFRMSMIAAGIDDAGETSELLVYINVAIGHGLAWLYAWEPSVPWYSVLFLAMQIVSQATIFYALSRMVPRRILLAVVQFTMAAYFWTHLQFTTTAALSTLAGATLLFETIRSQGTRTQLLGAWLLIVLGSLVRIQSGGLVGLLTIPAFGVFAWRHRRSLQWCRQIGFAAASVAAILWCQHVNSNAYETAPGWNDFHAVSRPVALVVNNTQHLMQIYNPKLGDHLIKAVEQTGMTRAEQEAMCIWLYSPPDDSYSAENVSAAANALAELKDPRKLPRFAIASLVALLQNNVFVFLFFVSCVFLTSQSEKENHTSHEQSDSNFRVPLFILQWSFFLAVMAYVHWNMKLPPRVYISAALATLMVNAVLASRNSLTDAMPKKFSKANNVLAILCLLGSGWIIIEQSQHSQLYVGERQMTKDDLQQQLKKGGPPLVITVPYPFDRLHPFDDLSWMQGLSYVYLDGHQLSPRQRAIVNPRFYISNRSLSLGAKKHLDRQFGTLEKVKQTRFGSVYAVANSDGDPPKK